MRADSVHHYSVLGQARAQLKLPLLSFEFRCPRQAGQECQWAPCSLLQFVNEQRLSIPCLLQALSLPLLVLAQATAANRSRRCLALDHLPPQPGLPRCYDPWPHQGGELLPVRWRGVGLASVAFALHLRCSLGCLHLVPKFH